MLCFCISVFVYGKLTLKQFKLKRQNSLLSTYCLISVVFKNVFSTFSLLHRALCKCVFLFYYQWYTTVPFSSLHFHSIPLSFLPPANAGCVLCRFLSRCRQEPRSVPEEWLEIQRNKTIIQQHFDIYIYSGAQLQLSEPCDCTQF